MGRIKRTFGFIVNHPLAKRHIARSICRFLIWQLQCNLRQEKLFIKEFLGPVKFYVRKGLAGLTGNLYVGLHEFHEMAFLLHFLRPEDNFFDIGANVGSYSLLACGVCGARGVAIEPAKATFELLAMNIALNKLQDKVIIINSAAGASNGLLTFTSSEDTTNHVVAHNEHTDREKVTVSAITIDSLAQSNSPALIKIDVEGYETEVLRGMTQTLERPGLKAIIIELNGSGERYEFIEEDIHHLLLSKKFKPYQYDAFQRTLAPTTTYGDFNTIYCRDLNFIERRLKTAQPIKVMGESI